MKSSRLGAAALKLSSSRSRLTAFATLLALVFLMGGGSRADIFSLVLLRPLAALFAVYAVLQVSREQLRAIRAPLVFLALVAALIAAQLVPLPPEIWQALPGRAVYADAYAAAGAPVPWQPLAIVPSRALNSLLSLIVPLAVLLNWAIQDVDRRPTALTFLWIAALASVGLGILQLLGSANGPLYLYRVTTNGMPVGLFANRNHQALMVAIGILLSGHLAAQALRRQRPAVPLLTAAGGAILVFAPFLLVTGSRAGLVMGAAMIAVAAILVASAWRERAKRHRATAPSKTIFVIAAAAAALLAAVVAASIWLSRSLALERLTGKSVELDVRVKVLPTLLDIARDQFPFGSGFGSFEFIYRQFEPTELMMHSYLNHAHNDWLQFVLEGGLPAAMILVAFLVWAAQATFRQWRSGGNRLAPETAVGVLILLAVGLFSFVDYPLRTPSFMAIFAIACAQLSRPYPRH